MKKNRQEKWKQKHPSLLAFLKKQSKAHLIEMFVFISTENENDIDEKDKEICSLEHKLRKYLKSQKKLQTKNKERQLEKQKMYSEIEIVIENYLRKFGTHRKVPINELETVLADRGFLEGNNILRKDSVIYTDTTLHQAVSIITPKVKKRLGIR